MWNITNVRIAISALLWEAASSDTQRCTLELSYSNAIYVPSLLYFRPPWKSTSVFIRQKRRLPVQTVRRFFPASVRSADTDAKQSKRSTTVPYATSSSKLNKTCLTTKHCTPARSPTVVRYVVLFIAASDIWKITRRVTSRKPTTIRANSATSGSALANICKRICSCTRGKSDTLATYAIRSSPPLETSTDTKPVTWEWSCTAVRYVWKGTPQRTPWRCTCTNTLQANHFFATFAVRDLPVQTTWKGTSESFTQEEGIVCVRSVIRPSYSLALLISTCLYIQERSITSDWSVHCWRSLVAIIVKRSSTHKPPLQYTRGFTRRKSRIVVRFVERGLGIPAVFRCTWESIRGRDLLVVMFVVRRSIRLCIWGPISECTPVWSRSVVRAVGRSLWIIEILNNINVNTPCKFLHICKTKGYTELNTASFFSGPFEIVSVMHSIMFIANDL